MIGFIWEIGATIGSPCAPSFSQGCYTPYGEMMAFITPLCKGYIPVSDLRDFAAGSIYEVALRAHATLDLSDKSMDPSISKRARVDCADALEEGSKEATSGQNDPLARSPPQTTPSSCWSPEADTPLSPISTGQERALTHSHSS
jgi:hypothetical protein